jgi:hypothetical protein
MKTLGLIGGTGPESTIEYYRLIIEAYREQQDVVVRSEPPNAPGSSWSSIRFLRVTSVFSVPLW